MYRSRHTNLTNLARQQSQPHHTPQPPPPCSSSLWADAIHHLQEQQQQQQQQQPSANHEQVDEAIRASSLRALRWSNIGQDYDWGRRRYAVDVTQRPAPPPPAAAAAAAAAAAQAQPEGDDANTGNDAFHRIPEALKELARAAVAPLGFEVEAEAGIVNFYPADASMGGAFLVGLFVCLSVCLFVCLSVCLPACLPASSNLYQQRHSPPCPIPSLPRPRRPRRRRRRRAGAPRRLLQPRPPRHLPHLSLIHI